MAIGLFILVRERTFADALAIRLEAEPDVGVVAALDADVVPPRLFVGNRVDVVLLDADIPDGAAFRLCEELVRAGQAPHVILTGQSSDPALIVRALQAGAVGWVGKTESLERLIDVIRGVARGETWLPPGQTGEVLRMLLPGPVGENGGDDDGGETLATLTVREREVLHCLATGIRRRDIAGHLHMSPNTVRTHLQNLMGKLGAHTALEAVTLLRRLEASPRLRRER
jgi:DNA-binding NarL/FixJ family response regulator